MITFLLGLIIGLLGGFIGGLYFYARKVHPRIQRETVTRATINSIVNGKGPEGDIIKINRTADRIKEEGEISLGDILEDE